MAFVVRVLEGNRYIAVPATAFRGPGCIRLMSGWQDLSVDDILLKYDDEVELNVYVKVISRHDDPFAAINVAMVQNVNSASSIVSSKRPRFTSPTVALSKRADLESCSSSLYATYASEWIRGMRDRGRVRNRQRCTKANTTERTNLKPTANANLCPILTTDSSIVNKSATMHPMENSNHNTGGFSTIDLDQAPADLSPYSSQ